MRRILRATACSPLPPERLRQLARVDDHERLRRPGQRDVELAQSLLVRCDQRRLDDHDVVELEALRLAWSEQRDSVPEIARRRLRDELLGSDHGQQAAARAEGAASLKAAASRCSSSTWRIAGGSAPVRYEIGGATSGAIVSSSGSASSMISRGTR